MSLAEERGWAQAVHPDPGSTLRPMVRRKGIVTAVDPTLQVDVGGIGVGVPAANLTGQRLAVGDVVWVDLPGDGRVQVIAAATDLTAWVPLSLVNGWQVQTGRTPRVRLVGDRVEFAGQLTGSGASSGTICTLPEPYRPDRVVILVTAHDSPPQVVRLNIMTSGVMQLADSASPDLGGPQLEGLFFTLT